MEKIKTLKAFECRIPSWDDGGYHFLYPVIAHSRSAAKYRTWQYVYGEDFTDKKYFEFQKFIKISTVGDIKPEKYYSDVNEFNRMKEHRDIPFAFQGMIVDVAGHKGWITGNQGFNLGVMFEESSNPCSNCHPHWEITYYDSEMNVIKDYKK